MALAGEIPVGTHTPSFGRTEANEALRMLKHEELKGAAVLAVS